VRAAAAYLFGWAKPVPVNFGAAQSAEADMIWVAAAGPFGQPAHGARLGRSVLKIAISCPTNGLHLPLRKMAIAGILVNVVLMLLNLLPIPAARRRAHRRQPVAAPLAWQYARLEPYGVSDPAAACCSPATSASCRADGAGLLPRIGILFQL
jgi:hypothetical protein